MVRIILLGFVAGFIAVLVFHQGTYWLLSQGEMLPPNTWSMEPVPPFGVPRVLSASFWGGLWGIALALLLASRLRLPALATGALFGAIALTFVALTLVPTLRGLPMGVGQLGRWSIGGMLNGAWGWGVALMLLKTVPLRKA